MGFAVEKLGDWVEGPEFKVEIERARAYAAATNDPIPEHVSGALAPPIFAIIPTWETLVMAMAAITPPDALMTVVHGEQDMFFRKPITPGMVLRTRAAPIGVHVKPNGTSAIARSETHDQEGDLVIEQYMTSFFRGITDGESGGEEAPAHKLEASVKSSDPVATATQAIDADQTFRYADASGDRMPIHLDDEIAKTVGLPGIIVHGLCTMAFASWAVVEAVAGSDPTRLKRLAVRFSKPVLPGQEITTTIWKAGERDGCTVFGFETRNPDGDVVIKDGLAEISR